MRLHEAKDSQRSHKSYLRNDKTSGLLPCAGIVLMADTASGPPLFHERALYIGVIILLIATVAWLLRSRAQMRKHHQEQLRLMEQRLAESSTQESTPNIDRAETTKTEPMVEHTDTPVAEHVAIHSGVVIEPTEITVSSLDDDLLNRVKALIEENISDVDYSVAHLSSDIGMTRGHLYKRMMAITGMAPLDLMRTIKVKRGRSLLEQGKTNVSEVADMVGLSAKQFSYHFKTMYGQTPSEFLRTRKEAS